MISPSTTTGTYIMSSPGSSTLRIFEWLELTTSGACYYGLLSSGAASTADIFRRGIIHGVYRATTQDHAGVNIGAGADLRVLNSLIYDIFGDTGATRDTRGVWATGSASKAYVRMCTIDNIVRTSGSVSAGVEHESASGTIEIENTVITGCSGQCVRSSTDVEQYNAADDTTVSGTGSIASITRANQYVSTTPGSEDYHILNSSADTFEAGTDLGTTYEYNVDLDGFDRTAITNWSIGAFDGNELRTSGPSGTLSVTQANQTSSASGRLVKRGTAAATEAADTLSAAGSVTHRGTINVTQADHTSVIAGRVIRRGTVAVTEADDTLSAAGGPLAPIGTVDANEDDDTLNASGRLVRRGTMAATQADQTMSAAGRVIRRGTVDVTQADQTLSAAGGPISNIKYGTVDVTQADNTLAAVGRVIRRGDIVVTQSDQAMAAAGRVVHRGTVNVTSQDHWMTATGYPESTPPVPDSGSSIWSFLLATLRRTLYATDRDQQNGDRKP